MQALTVGYENGNDETVSGCGPLPIGVLATFGIHRSLASAGQLGAPAAGKFKWMHRDMHDGPPGANDT